MVLLAKIIFPYQLWLVFLCCIALGLTYAFALYYKNRTLKIAPGITVLLATLRFTTVSAIVFLLFSPLLLSVEEKKENPLLLMVMDNSQSMQFDSTKLPLLLKNWDQLKESLQNHFRIENITFGENTQAGNSNFSFMEEETNFNALFDYINRNYNHYTQCYMVLASDGIYNSGNNPIFSRLQPGISLYTVGHGDTTQYPDLSIQNIFSNNITFLNNEFPAEVLIKAQLAKGEKRELLIKQNDTIIAKEVIDITSDHFSQRVPFLIKADKKGVQHYTAEITSLDQEKNYSNNIRDFRIRVIDEQTNILLLSNHPHPDIASIKKAIAKKKEYNISTALISSFDISTLMNYDMVILHQLPNSHHISNTITETLFKKKIPFLAILGPGTDLSKFNSFPFGIRINEFKNSFNATTASLNNNFEFFTISPQFKQLIPVLPPLFSPFGNYETSHTMHTMLFQKIENLTTSMPLLSLSYNSDHRMGILCGIGLWQWRIKNFISTSNHEAFDGWINSIIQYLSIQKTKERLIVSAEKEYSPHTPINIYAELYNAALEKTTAPEMLLSLTDKNGNEFKYRFEKENDRYHLPLGTLPEGNYSYSATSTLAGESLIKNGEFSVFSINREHLTTTADFTLLKQLAKNHNGSYFDAQNILQLTDTLLTQEKKIHSVTMEKTYSPFINFKWFLILIIIGLSLEWFLRKYFNGKI